MAEIEREFGWEDTITNDESYELLPEGEYTFKVLSIERGRFNGSDKMPACNVADIALEIISPTTNRPVRINHKLFLHSRYEGQIGEFFVSIGAKKKGEPLRMNWTLVPGSMGQCKVGLRIYNGNQYNQIKKFIEPAQVSYIPGKF